MTVVAPGTPVPDFQLRTEEGEPFTQSDLAGQTSVLVFYPHAFSAVCSDQFNLYEEVLGIRRALRSGRWSSSVSTAS